MLRLIQVLNKCLQKDLLLYLYKSPTQYQESFCENFEKILDNLKRNNPFLLVVMGDANDQTSFEGNKCEHITSQLGLSPVINKPKHILDTFSSCIDLFFNFQPNLVIESAVHSSLHQKWYNLIIYAKFNLTFYYPPLYCREIWHYQYADIDLISRVISQFNWYKGFSNTSLNEKVCIFSHIISKTL